jgi:hypothetical protein
MRLDFRLKQAEIDGEEEQEYRRLEEFFLQEFLKNTPIYELGRNLRLIVF